MNTRNPWSWVERGPLIRRRWDGARSPRRKKMISGWTPTPSRVVTKALQLAGLNADDVLYDLGCGDGRVVVRAARMFGAKAVGFELRLHRIRETRNRAKRCGVDDLVRVRQQDMLAIPDLGSATVVYLYLPQRAVNKLKPILRRGCRKGTRIVCVSTWFRGWKAKEQITIRLRRTNWWIGLWIVEKK